jgi:hypothetical protein
MFLGPDGWLGIDIGATGSAVLYAALWLFLVHLSKHSETAFPVDAPLAERQAWVAVVFVSLMALFWFNFMFALRGLGPEADQISNSASRHFSINLGMFIFAWIVVSGVVRSGNRESVQIDERDLRVQHAAGRVGSGLMAMLIIGLVAALALRPDYLAPWLRPLIVANALVGLLIAKTLTENVWIVLRYRREFA